VGGIEGGDWSQSGVDVWSEVKKQKTMKTMKTN